MAFHVTQCPGCDSTFNTSARMLTMAAGKVRCGSCLTIFEAPSHFIDEDPIQTGIDQDSVFVGNNPQDYFDPSSFLTRSALTEEIESTNSSATADDFSSHTNDANPLPPAHSLPSDSNEQYEKEPSEASLLAENEDFFAAFDDETSQQADTGFAAFDDETSQQADTGFAAFDDETSQQTDTGLEEDSNSAITEEAANTANETLDSHSTAQTDEDSNETEDPSQTDEDSNEDEDPVEGDEDSGSEVIHLGFEDTTATIDTHQAPEEASLSNSEAPNEESDDESNNEVIHLGYQDSQEILLAEQTQDELKENVFEETEKQLNDVSSGEESDFEKTEENHDDVPTGEEINFEETEENGAAGEVIHLGYEDSDEAQILQQAESQQNSSYIDIETGEELDLSQSETESEGLSEESEASRDETEREPSSTQPESAPEDIRLEFSFSIDRSPLDVPATNPESFQDPISEEATDQPSEESRGESPDENLFESANEISNKTENNEHEAVTSDLFVVEETDDGNNENEPLTSDLFVVEETDEQALEELEINEGSEAEFSEAIDEAFEETVFEETEFAEPIAEELQQASASQEELEEEISEAFALLAISEIEDSNDLHLLESGESETSDQDADLAQLNDQKTESEHDQTEAQEPLSTEPLPSGETDEQATQEEAVEPELSSEEIRARALNAQYQDEESLEAIPAEKLAMLERVSAPLELLARRENRLLHRLFLIAMMFVLSASLAGQYLWQRIPLYSQLAQLRPFYELGCELFACELPAYSNIDAIRSDNLIVRSHPTLDNGLTVNVSFRNTAEFPQAFPILILSFNTSSNQTLALREFAPREYLAPGLRTLEFMPPRNPVQVSLNLIDPGPNAVNYTLAFRRP